MSIANMHYDFKQKLNKIDSQKYRNLLIQEADWKFNEALGVFIKTNAEPRYNDQLGVETDQRTTDDLREVIVEAYQAVVNPFGDNRSYTAVLPANYWFLLNVDATAIKGSCNTGVKCIQRTHDDRTIDSPFDISSFEWQEVDYRFYKDGIRIFTDGTFRINNVYLDYILKPPYMHYAAGVNGGAYNLADGTTLTGIQECIFTSDSVQREIVDIAVAITTGDLQMSDYQIKAAKLKMND